MEDKQTCTIFPLIYNSKINARHVLTLTLFDVIFKMIIEFKN